MKRSEGILASFFELNAQTFKEWELRLKQRNQIQVVSLFQIQMQVLHTHQR